MEINLRKYLKSSFVKNTAILTSATTLGQVITLVTAPILTRIYDPSSYDILGIYMMVTGLVGAFATLQYHNVIITVREEKEAISAVKLCIIISFLVSLLTLALVGLFYGFIKQQYINPDISLWLLFSPLSIFFSGSTVALSAWANRVLLYKKLSVSRILSAILVPLFSISIGLKFGGAFGLLVGLLFSQIFPAVYLAVYFLKLTEKEHLKTDIPYLKGIASRHVGFVLYSLPSEFINNFVNQLPIIFFARYYGLVGVIGNFNLSNRLLGMPIQLISTSVSEVFRQKASLHYNQDGNCEQVFLKTFKVLSLFAIVPFALLMIFAPWVFSFVFGEKWAMAGTISQILAPMFMLKFIVSPLTYIFFIAKKQKEDFYGHIFMVALVILAFVVVRIFTQDYIKALIAYSLAYCITYIVYFIFSYRFSKGKG